MHSRVIEGVNCKVLTREWIISIWEAHHSFFQLINEIGATIRSMEFDNCWQG